MLDPDGKSLAYSSYTFGDPATPIPRSYIGEPTKTRLSHPGSEVFHGLDVHGGDDSWRRRPELEAGEFPGDFLFHSQIGEQSVSGMWSFWRVFDTAQADLANMPPDAGHDLPSIAESGNSLDLIGTVVEGKTLVPAVEVDLPTELAIEDFIASLLPLQGVALDDEDATVWDWVIDYQSGDPTKPLVLGEPDDATVWANYASATPGVRPEVLFNLSNGRLAWPQFKPHLGQRPPFSPNGHGGAPWLGEESSATRPDGLCPTDAVSPVSRRLHYPTTAIDLPIQVAPTVLDPTGMIFALNEDIDSIRAGAQAAEPLVVRSNVGDCVSLIFTSEQEDEYHGGYAKVSMHTDSVQFDPQASDGVITGFSYEQSIRPYAGESRTLTAPAERGATDIDVSNVDRLRVGISIGVGLAEGMCDPSTGTPVPTPDNSDRPCTEIRTIAAISGQTITLGAPLKNVHSAGEAVGVEFVQYLW